MEEVTQEQPQKIRKVLIGTPSIDGRVDVWYCNSLVNTVKLGLLNGISIQAVYTSYDSLIQRCRNSLFKIAVEQDFDDLIFIDSDVEWQPDWIFKLLSAPEPIVGAALVKKAKNEGYTVKLVNKELKWNDSKTLIEVDGVGTGFLKISKFALNKLWEISTPYTDDNVGVENRMVFDVVIENGDLISEDYVACNKWKKLGYKVWIDPTITCNHIGNKKYEGNFEKFIEIHGYK
jgi:hypothetical protein